MSEPSLGFNSAPPTTYDSARKTLGGYLAGLIEGDGSIIVPKTIRNQKSSGAGGLTFWKIGLRGR